jgi:hypothetical protein
MESLLNPHHPSLRAAVGWLELGLPSEGLAELSSLPLEVKEHPMVLGLRWALHAKEQSWADAFAVAGTWVLKAPEEASAWISRSYAARRYPGGSLTEALALLEPAGFLFPEDETIPFNLACYQAQLGNLEEAWRWWAVALSRGDARELCQRALSDPDLQPLWPQLRARATPSK